jgi:predicted transcriptional regulator
MPTRPGGGGVNLVRRTVQRDLSKMVDLGLIKEIAKSKTDPTRYYELL